MIRDDRHWAELTERFYTAAIDGTGWGDALGALADATGSRSGELIGIGPGGALPFNVMTNVDPGMNEAFVACGGSDPAVNPRVAAGMRAPALRVLADYDFISPDEHRRNPHYQDFARAWDIPFICLTTLMRSDDLLVGLAVLRSARQGHIEPEQREAFAAIAPQVRGAVRTQMALEGRGAALLTGAFEALSMPAFVCDGRGRVGALTPAAEALVRAGSIRLQGGVLEPSHRDDVRRLRDAIDAAALPQAAPGAPLLRTVVLRAPAAGARPLVLDVVRLPAGSYAFSFQPRVLVVVRGGRPAARTRAPILQVAYGLTPAEADIALLLGDGLDSAAIAARRRSSVGTVRVQIKRVLAKLDVKRQIELAARLRDA